MSQEKLGEAIGLTFQQVQKYERGSNRISAGTLFRLSQILDVPVSFFFDGLESGNHVAGGFLDDGKTISRREARLLRLWRAAPAIVGEEILALLSSLSPHLPDQSEESVTIPMTVPAVAEPSPVAETASAARRQRRRHGAVWDPADIYNAPSRQQHK